MANQSTTIPAFKEIRHERHCPPCPIRAAADRHRECTRRRPARDRPGHPRGRPFRTRRASRHHERANVTLPADQTVELFVVYDGTARIEGRASTIMVVNGEANLVGARADRVIAIQSEVTLDRASLISGDI